MTGRSGGGGRRDAGDPRDPFGYRNTGRIGVGESDGEADGAASFAGLGLQFAAAIVLFMFLGKWADEGLGTSPWLLILGVFVGAGGGFYAIYRRLITEQAREEARRAQGSGDGGRRRGG
ncbi:MAG: AtpZ/AtpI family protein [Gemmatimonadaceae bacterium]